MKRINLLRRCRRCELMIKHIHEEDKWKSVPFVAILESSKK